MDGGFPYGDIIVIAAIAAFVILRYRAMLGEKTGHDAEQVGASKPLAEFERIIQIPEREKKAETSDRSKKTEKDYGALSETFAAIAAIDREFSPEEFIEGARAAFEMVVEAYNKRDHETLSMLLSPAIYANFKTALDNDMRDGRVAATTLVAMAKSEMVAATLQGNIARITVEFVTEQVPLVRDLQGAIIEGDAAAQEVIDDRWVFERDLSSGSPDWKIIET